MKINVSFDLSTLNSKMRNYERNLAFSTAQALNDAALEAQRRVRLHLRDAFKIRNAAFMDRSIKIFAFANVRANRPYAEIGVDSRKPRLLLSLFEEGGARGAFKGHNVAVPITGQAARPSFADSVRPDLTFQALNFRRGPITQAGHAELASRRAGKNRKRKLSGQYYVWQGQQRTFILTHTARHPMGGVFQRTGPKRDDIRMLYSFQQHVRLRKALSFVETSEGAFNDVFQRAFVRRFYRL
ncbi:MAG: hypothetical protein JSR67_03725 [Proteobacteria bacterium]|nr:hypothetical protein [Pseudomonadota bacterium]